MKTLEKVAHKLIINGTLTEQCGLFYGKIGIAVFFFNYARYTGNELYWNYGMDLIEETQKQIKAVKIPLRYDIGLAGIGCGFEYFLQNSFFEGENNEILYDFDERIICAAKNERYSSLNLHDGLSGLGRYFICRLRGNTKNNEKLYEALKHVAREISKNVTNKRVSINEQADVYLFYCELIANNLFLEKYDKSFQICKKWNFDIQNIFPYMSKIQRLLVYQKYFDKDMSKIIDQEWKNWSETETISPINMTLLNGWASKGLLFMTYSKCISNEWLNLL